MQLRTPVSLGPNKCGVIWYDLVLFAQPKKREKLPWRSATFSKVAGLFVI